MLSWCPLVSFCFCRIDFCLWVVINNVRFMCVLCGIFWYLEQGLFRILNWNIEISLCGVTLFFGVCKCSSKYSRNNMFKSLNLTYNFGVVCLFFMYCVLCKWNKVILVVFVLVISTFFFQSALWTFVEQEQIVISWYRKVLLWKAFFSNF